MINEAALAAVKAGREAVSQKDLLEAVEVVIAGKEKKDRILGEEEKKIVSYHEVGHAMAIAVQKNTEPVQKITIVPRTMGALGYTMQVPEEEKYLMSKEQMLSELVTLFGGRAAEEVVFNSVTTGASNDIERATQIARAMVTQYGMSERFGLMGLESVQNRYLDGRAVMNCSDATGALIDEEVKEMLKVAYDKAKKIIEDHREVMDEIAEFLIEKETITGKEFMEIYNKSLKKDELESVEANVEEDKEKTELSEAETVDIQEELKKLPAKPGVYLMHNAQDEIIYVGKARILKNRVRQYFQSSYNKSVKIQHMVSHIAYFEYIITDSELEALVLECNLIKEHRPHYNTMLKDDKSYPYIRVTVQEDYPRILFCRQVKRDKSKYFGPYTSAGAVKDTIELMRKVYKSV